LKYDLKTKTAFLSKTCDMKYFYEKNQKIEIAIFECD